MSKSVIFAREVFVVQWIEFQIPVLKMWVRPPPRTQKKAFMYVNAFFVFIIDVK